MSDTRKGLPLSRFSIDKVFPKLTSDQINRIAAHGLIRTVQRDEVLIEHGNTSVPFFVLISGEIDVVRPVGLDETLVTSYKEGQFTGEVNTLSGRPTLFRMRVTKPGEVIQIDRPHMLALVQTDTELGDILIKCHHKCRYTIFQIFYQDTLILHLFVLLCWYRICLHIHLILSSDLLFFHLGSDMELSLEGVLQSANLSVH